MENLDWIAWAAGLFEGEGCISIASYTRGPRYYQYPRLKVHMTDKDTVKKFKEAVQCGNVSFRKKATPNRKDTWLWELCNTKEIEKIIGLFWPYLGERRRAKAIELNIYIQQDLEDN